MNAIDGYEFYSNYPKRQADLVEKACRELGIDIRREAAFTAHEEPLTSHSAIYLKEGASMSKVWLKLSRPERENYVEKVQYPGSLDDVLVIQTHEWGITDSEGEKPVVATDVISTCMVLVGYSASEQQGVMVNVDPNKGFLLHFLETSGAKETVRQLEQKLGTEGDWQFRILGGNEKGQIPRAEELIGLLADSTVLNGKFVEKDLYGQDMVRSIALDTRTGEVYEFRGLAPVEERNALLGILGGPAVYVDNKGKKHITPRTYEWVTAEPPFELSGGELVPTFDGFDTKIYQDFRKVMAE